MEFLCHHAPYSCNHAWYGIFMFFSIVCNHFANGYVFCSNETPLKYDPFLYTSFLQADNLSATASIYIKFRHQTKL